MAEIGVISHTMGFSVLHPQMNGLLSVLLVLVLVSSSVSSTNLVVDMHNTTSAQQIQSNNNTSSRPNLRCFDGKSYLSLLKCTSDCEEVRHSVDTNISNVNALYKLIILNATQYEIGKDGKLLAKLPQSSFTSDIYSISSNDAKAYVCYPMTKQYNECEKWLVSSEDFEYDADSRILHIRNHKTYEVDQFYLSITKAKAKTCVIKEEAATVRRTVQLCTVSVSAAMLLITIVLALWIPALNIKQNYVLMSHLVMLVAAYSVMLLKLIIDKKEAHDVCMYLSLFQQYFFLSAFFWINVQAYDLCRKLTNMRWRPDAKPMCKRKSWIIYSCYAWLLPLIITMLTLSAELLLPHDSTFYPALRDYCWFRNDKLVPLVYFYGPISVVLFVNFILFIVTVISLFKVGRGVASANKKIHQQLFFLYLKLVLVMGLCWVMEVASWAEGDTSSWWAFTDTINCLQGFFIFIVYMCKRRQLKIILHHSKVITSTLSKAGGSQEDGTSLTKNESSSSAEAKSSANQSEVQSTQITAL